VNDTRRPHVERTALADSEYFIALASEDHRTFHADLGIVPARKSTHVRKHRNAAKQFAIIAHCSLDSLKVKARTSSGPQLTFSPGESLVLIGLSRCRSLCLRGAYIILLISRLFVPLIDGKPAHVFPAIVSSGEGTRRNWGSDPTHNSRATVNQSINQYTYL